MAGNWAKVYSLTHELTLALRAIERFIVQPRTQVAIETLTVAEVSSILEAVLRGELTTIRHMVRRVDLQTLDDLTYTALRERASTLRIPCFNKLTRAELIYNIRLIEEKIQTQLEHMLPTKPVKGFIDGAGI
jgi:chromosomal replication initiation ATPase DnaA